MHTRIFECNEELNKRISDLKKSGKKIVFTNGVFDLIHRGHIEYLTQAKNFGDILIVGMNSDSSVRKIKGDKRPVIKQTDRAIVLSNLKPVDYVVIFDEETPLELIKKVVPDILIKGADWNEDEIVGADFIKQNGGSVHRIKYVENCSSTNIIDTVIKKFCND